MGLKFNPLIFMGLDNSGSGGGVTSFNGLTGAVTGAKTDLSNLASVQINTNLVPDTNNAYNIGSTTKVWAQVYANNFRTPDAAGATGSPTFGSGDSSGSSSGNVTIESGSGSTTSGEIDITTGTAGSTRGDIVLSGRYIALSADIATDAGGLPIINLADPVAASDAATKQYVDSVSSVKARYFNATATITGADSKVTYSTASYDSNSAYSTGTFTVPTNGNYHVGAQIQIIGTVAINNTVSIAIYKNGTLYSKNTQQLQAATTTLSLVSIDDDIQVVATDTLEIRASSNIGSPTVVSSNSLNFVNFRRNGS